MSVVIVPHTDDEALFCSFTILREKPVVIVVFDGHVQANRGLSVTAEQRRAETAAACEILGGFPVFLGFRDDNPTVSPSAVWDRVQATQGRLGASVFDSIWAPDEEIGGHDQHNLVAKAVPRLMNVTRYLTYSRVLGKSRSQNEVPILDRSWIGKKLRALSCYESQFDLDPRMGCWPHFIQRDQREYYA